VAIESVINTDEKCMM